MITLTMVCGACSEIPARSSITSAGLFLDSEGTQPTDKYDARAIFYCTVTLDQPIPDSTLRASWVAIETNRLAPNSVIKIDEIVPTSPTAVFKLHNEGNFWPTGHYKLFLYLDGKEIQVIDFDVYHDYFTE